MAKKKRKKPEKYPKCPCCGQERHRTEVKEALRKMKMIDSYNYPHYQPGTDTDNYIKLQWLQERWACDACLREKRAIVADHQVQYYSTLNWPHMAYYDTQHTCRSCGDEFTFSKEEKRHWFEELQFYIEAKAVRCQSCRKELNAEKLKHKTLSALLQKGIDNLEMEELELVIGIYEAWDKEHKIAYYRSVQRKLELKQSKKH